MPNPSAPSRSRSSSSLGSNQNVNNNTREESLDDINDLSDFSFSEVATVKLSPEEDARLNAQRAALKQQRQKQRQQQQQQRTIPRAAAAVPKTTDNSVQDLLAGAAIPEIKRSRPQTPPPQERAPQAPMTTAPRAKLASSASPAQTTAPATQNAVETKNPSAKSPRPIKRLFKGGGQAASPSIEAPATPRDAMAAAPTSAPAPSPNPATTLRHTTYNQARTANAAAYQIPSAAHANPTATPAVHAASAPTPTPTNARFRAPISSDSMTVQTKFAVPVAEAPLPLEQPTSIYPPDSHESKVAQARDRIFGDRNNKTHNTQKPERKQREVQAEEIAKRTAEIWGPEPEIVPNVPSAPYNPVAAAAAAAAAAFAAPSVSYTPQNAPSSLKQTMAAQINQAMNPAMMQAPDGSMIPVMTASANLATSASAAMTNAQNAMTEDTPADPVDLLPAGPSTLINGRAFDFSQSAETVNKKIEEVMQSNLQHSHAPTGGIHNADSELSYTQRAFAALNRLNENSTRISGVASALRQRHIEQEPNISTVITSAPQNNTQGSAGNTKGSAVPRSPFSTHNITTILTDSRGRLVADDLGHLTHESDSSPASPLSAAFKSAAALPEPKGNQTTRIARSNAPLVTPQIPKNSLDFFAPNSNNAIHTTITGSASHTLGQRHNVPTVSLMSLTDPINNSTSSNGESDSVTALPNGANAGQSGDMTLDNANGKANTKKSTVSDHDILAGSEAALAIENELLRKKAEVSNSKLFTAGLKGASILPSNQDPALQKPEHERRLTINNGAIPTIVPPLNKINPNNPLNTNTEASRNPLHLSPALQDELSSLSTMVEAAQNLTAQITNNAAKNNTAAITEEAITNAEGAATNTSDPFNTPQTENERQPQYASSANAPLESHMNNADHNVKHSTNKNLFSIVPNEEPPKIYDLSNLAEAQQEIQPHLTPSTLDKIVLTPPQKLQPSPVSNDKEPILDPPNSPNWTNPLSQRPEESNPLARPTHRDPGFTLSLNDDDLPPLLVPNRNKQNTGSTQRTMASATSNAADDKPATLITKTIPVAHQLAPAQTASIPTAIANASQATMQAAQATTAQANTTAPASNVLATANQIAANNTVSPTDNYTDEWTEGDEGDYEEEDYEGENESEGDNEALADNSAIANTATSELNVVQTMIHNYIKHSHANLNSCNYFTGRAINNDVAARFNLGYDPFYRTLPQNQMLQELNLYQLQQLSNLEMWQAAIIPLSRDSFVAYKIATINNSGVAMPSSWELDERRYVGTMQCFNLEAIAQAAHKKTPVFITGSEIDALTLESLNMPALALGHASNIGTLSRYLQDFMQNLRDNHNAPVSLSSDHLGLSCYVSLPNGQLWENAQKQLQNYMRELNITCHVVDLHSPYSSINLCLLYNRSLLLNKLYHLNEISDVRLQEAVVSNEPQKSPALILNLENLAKLQLSNLLYTLASPAAALSRLVQSCLIENQHNSLIYAGSKMQWNMLCTMLSLSPNNADSAMAAAAAAAEGGASVSALGISTYSYRTKFLEMPMTLNFQDIENTLHHGLTMAKLNGMEKFTLMVDTFALESNLCAQLSARIAQLCVEFNIPVIVWCSLEQKHFFEGNSLQSIEMSQGSKNEIIFTTLDNNCHNHTFSTAKS